MNRTTGFTLTGAISTLAALLITVVGAESAKADKFDDFNGGFQEIWQFGSVDAGGNPSGSFNGGQVINDQLVLADPNSAAAGGAATGFGVLTEIFSDVRVEGIINPNGDAAISPSQSLLARGNVFTAQFYAAEINYGSGELIIFRNDGLTSASNLVQTDIPGLSTDDSIFLRFRLVGDSLSAFAFDAPGGTLLASVSTTDSMYSSGLSGVLPTSVSAPTAPLLGVFDDIGATVIPEPATALLGLAGVSTVFLRRRRRQG